MAVCRSASLNVATCSATRQTTAGCTSPECNPCLPHSISAAKRLAATSCGLLAATTAMVALMVLGLAHVCEAVVLVAGRSMLEDGEPVPLSSIECAGAAWETRVCWAHNLLLLGDRDTAIFVVKEPAQVLPDGGRLSEFAGQHTAIIQLKEVLTVVSQQEAAALLSQYVSAANSAPGSRKSTATIKRHGRTENSGGSAVGRRQLQNAAEPAAAAAAFAQAPGHSPLDVVEMAVGLQPFLLANWWHTLDDVSQVAFRFCKFLGTCTYADMQRTRTAVLLIGDTQPLHKVPGPAREALACFGSTFRLESNQTVAHLQRKLKLRGAVQRPVLVQTAFFGVGDEITHPFLAPELHLQRANDSMRELQIDVLRHCAGLPTESPRRSVPNLRIINREFDAGRSIVGGAQALYHLERMMPPSLEYNAHETFLAGRTFSEQARLFDETDIVVIPHGAAAGNLIFLPRTAVMVDVSSMGSHRWQEVQAVEKLPHPRYNVTAMVLHAEAHTDPNIDKLAQWDAFARLSDAEKLQLLLRGRLGQQASEDLAQEKLGGWHNLLYYYFYRPPVEQLATAMQRALQVWYEKQALQRETAAYA